MRVLIDLDLNFVTGAKGTSNERDIQKATPSALGLEEHLKNSFAKQDAYIETLLGDSSIRGCCD